MTRNGPSKKYRQLLRDTSTRVSAAVTEWIGMYRIRNGNKQPTARNKTKGRLRAQSSAASLQHTKWIPARLKASSNVRRSSWVSLLPRLPPMPTSSSTVSMTSFMTGIGEGRGREFREQ